jgi:ferrochelatase
VRESLQAGPVDHHVFSFHGLPQRQVDRGDPYPRECDATARALAGALELPAERWTLVYQSRFGPEPWLQPYADVAVPALARRAARVLVTCPGFAADCLETIDEIGTLLAERFRAAGGAELRLTPCLNDHPAWVAALLALVRERLSGSVA